MEGRGEVFRVLEGGRSEDLREVQRGQGSDRIFSFTQIVRKRKTVPFHLLMPPLKKTILFTFIAPKKTTSYGAGDGRGPRDPTSVTAL